MNEGDPCIGFLWLETVDCFPFYGSILKFFFIPKNGGSVTWCTKIFTVVKYIIY